MRSIVLSQKHLWPSCMFCNNLFSFFSSRQFYFLMSEKNFSFFFFFVLRRIFQLVYLHLLRYLWVETKLSAPGMLEELCPHLPKQKLNSSHLNKSADLYKLVPAATKGVVDTIQRDMVDGQVTTKSLKRNISTFTLYHSVSPIGTMVCKLVQYSPLSVMPWVI